MHIGEINLGLRSMAGNSINSNKFRDGKSEDDTPRNVFGDTGETND